MAGVQIGLSWIFHCELYQNQISTVLRGLSGVKSHYKKDVYPLPRIDETLEALGGACLFTTLDLRAGYWQINEAKNDRNKTAFTTKRGLYRFKRMPFGLTNAPATFQRLMNGGLNWTTCLVYLDDIVVFTQGNIERHVLQLAAIQERLSAAGLTLKLKKCVFAAESMEYLGHFLSKEGVRPLNRLVMAVTEFPRPKDVVEIKRFVHLAGYYRKFIEAFGSIVESMTRLLKKDTWTEEQEFDFSRVKMILTTRPLLLCPNFRLPFRLITDESKVGLGACLMQDQGRGWQPIAYASKVINDAEANYSITELECLAVVWSEKLFRPYLYGRAFTIITDHAALKWLMTCPNLAGRLHRWSLTLQEYEFDVLYAPMWLQMLYRGHLQLYDRRSADQVGM
ncbi:LOW QUALITY PROTEIN: Gag-pol fusion protein [Phytophthora palmivora]|uniref:Gag-pol fusion protein n=1 Tax=Phytophthora palmivora TaxID=4796 RepID=A0A2P4YP77_9STRA|nr:LOW QUALITY PROTEIN: Gag-pol fusion protein [Phytophthora palmivora]